MITTPSGLQYLDTTVGEGAEARKGQSVTVHYTGWLYNDGVQGGKFDSSKDRNDPFVFSLGAGMVIRGWDEGVAGMKVGGARTLIIPAALGYGARGVIPPNATLKFDVELLGVKGCPVVDRAAAAAGRQPRPKRPALPPFPPAGARHLNGRPSPPKVRPFLAANALKQWPAPQFPPRSHPLSIATPACPIPSNPNPLPR